MECSPVPLRPVPVHRDSGVDARNYRAPRHPSRPLGGTPTGSRNDRVRAPHDIQYAHHRDQKLTYHHSFDGWPPASASPEPPGGDEEVRPGWKVAADRLRAAVDRGLVFYWTLTSAASEVAGGARSRLSIEASERPGHAYSAQDDSDSGLPPRETPPHLQHGPPPVSTSLVIDRGDVSRDGNSAIESALASFTNAAQPFVDREQWHRTLCYHFSEYRAIQSQTAHDLRALLQPLLLHVDQLRRTGSATSNGLQLLDDLTRALVEWVEEDLEGGRLAKEVRLPSPSPGDGTELQEALEEALEAGARRVRPTRFPDQLSELAVDRPVLVAGLEELLQLCGDRTENLRVDRTGDGSAALRIEFDSAPATAASKKRRSGGPDHPPVVGGLLNLVAWMGGAIHIEAAPGEDGVVEVELPLDPSSGPDAL